MNERIISRNKRLSSVFERLQRQSLYSIKEFTSPINIVQESNRLIKLRQVNYAGFLREVTNCFPYFLDTSEPRLADPNKLTSIILTLQSPFDPSKWKPSDGVLSYSTILLQDTLLGKNVDFLRGKKESSFIMPAYMILRSLREKNSLWVSGIFLRLKKSQQEKLIIETNELKNRILSSINIPWIKDNVENLLKQTLDFNILKPEGEIEEEKKEEPLSKTVPVALYIKKFDRFADEKLQSTNKPSLEQSAFISAFNKFINIDFSQGKINISPDEELQKRMKIESNYKDFYGIFSDDLDQFAAFTTMSILSSKNNQINLWIKNLEGKKGYYQKIRNITNAFNRSFEDICTNNNVFDNLVDAYKKIISDKRFEDFDNLNFSLLNQKLSALLYSHYPVINKKGQPDIVKLADFLEVPGVKESILALKKTLLIKMTKNDFPGPIDELKVFPGNSDITSFEISNHNFLYQDKKVFSLKDLKKIDDNEMVLFLAFSNITRYIQDNNIGVKLIVDKEGGFLIEIPDELLQGFKEPINMNGYPIILSTGTASGDKEAFLNFMWKNVDIAKMYAS